MVWQYLNGRSPLNLRVALKFARGLQVPVREFSPRLADELAAAGADPDSAPALMTHMRIAGVPVVGTVQAGDDGFWAELDYPVGHGEGHIRYPTNDKDAYAVRVKGDSMRPRIKPGEFVVVEPRHPCKPGDEVVVKTRNGRSMVKVLASSRNGMVELLSINDDHKPITLDIADIELMHHVAGIAKSALHSSEEGET
jgi:phage repressor protein C with HTH and peptisase S24 domain